MQAVFFAEEIGNYKIPNLLLDKLGFEQVASNSLFNTVIFYQLNFILVKENTTSVD